MGEFPGRNITKPQGYKYQNMLLPQECIGPVLHHKQPANSSKCNNQIQDSGEKNLKPSSFSFLSLALDEEIL